MLTQCPSFSFVETKGPPRQNRVKLYDTFLSGVFMSCHHLCLLIFVVSNTGLIQYDFLSFHFEVNCNEESAFVIAAGIHNE